MQMTIGKKLGILILINFIALGIIIGLLVHSESTNYRKISEAERERLSVTDLRELDMLLHHQIKEITDYAWRGKKENRERFEGFKKEFEELLKKIKTHIELHKEEEKNAELKEIRENYEKFLVTALHMFAFKEQAKLEELEKAGDEFKVSAMGICERIDKFIDGEEEGVSNAMQTIIKVSKQAAILSVVVGLVLGSLVIFLGVLIAWGVTKAVRKGILRITTASNQILAANQQQATGIEEEATQISQTATSAKQLTITSRQVADRASQIAKSSASSVQMANSGAQAVENVMGGMERIKESVLETAKKIEGLGERSQAITEIVTLIEDIADQTNLLSLNAAIEAARAGEQGKGFAVVADAIGKLAERTTKSTKDISELIKAIQQETSSCVLSMEESTKETEKGSSLAQEAGTKLREIVTSFEQVSQSAKEISLSSQQQSSGSEQISKAMMGIDQIMKQSAAAAKQSTASARDLVALAEEFKKIVGEVKTKERA